MNYQRDGVFRCRNSRLAGVNKDQIVIANFPRHAQSFRIKMQFSEICSTKINQNVTFTTFDTWMIMYVRFRLELRNGSSVGKASVGIIWLLSMRVGGLLYINIIVLTWSSAKNHVVVHLFKMHFLWCWFQWKTIVKFLWKIIICVQSKNYNNLFHRMICFLTITQLCLLHIFYWKRRAWWVT